MNNPFLDACGANGPLLLNMESPGQAGETRAYDLPFVLAGRDPRSDLRLGHPDVSERHAYFQIVDGQVLCIDLGSRLGIFQGGKCQRLGYLERERAVRIGPYRIRLLGGDREAGDVAPSEAPPTPLPLELSHRSVRNSRCDLPGGLALVGSASDCQIRLVDPSVSNYHCSLVHTSGGVWVVDLLGQGGVRVNGQDVAYAQLHEGDSLQIGHSVIRLLEAADATIPAESIPPAAPPQAIETPAESRNGYHTPTAELAPVGSNGRESPAAETAEMVERVLGPIVSQVGLLQQQMVEEIHQARAMLFETFSTLQQEQTTFINHELDQIRQLSEELHALRADLERQTRLLTDRFLCESSSTRLGTASHSTPALPSPVSSGPVRNGHAPTQSVAFSRPDPENGLIRGHNEQAHAKLCVRIAKLQKKQLTRWERLLSIFPGATPGKSTT